MASWEHQLLSRIIRTGDMNSVLQWGISYEDFLTSEGRAIFQHLLSYFQMPETSGAVIGPYALQQQYPTFHLCDDGSMTADALCHEVRQNRIKTEGHELIVKASELLEANPMAAVNQLSNGSNYLQSIGTTRKTDVFMDESMGRTMQRYELKEQGVDLSVCPIPWAPLQEATGGIEEEDYIVIYGRPKSMKTWVLAFLIAWCIDQGKRMLIYTKEMTADNIFQRVAAVLAGVRYHEFRRAKLNPEEKAAIYAVWRYIYAIRQQQPIVCLSAKDAGNGGDTVPWLRSKVEQHKPDICCIDGMYLMASSSNNPRQKDNARVRDISRSLRQMNLDTRVPIISTIQANREAAKHADANLDEIAFSDAIGQDATLAMRVINEKHQPTLALVVGGSREYDLEGFRIYGLPAYNFEYAGPLTTAEVIAAQQSDNPTDPTKGRKKAVKADQTQPDEVAQAAQKFKSMNTGQ